MCRDHRIKRAHGIIMPDHPTSLDVIESPLNTRDDDNLAIDTPRDGFSNERTKMPFMKEGRVSVHTLLTP